MATRQARLRSSKEAEKRVVRYLSGPDASRDWKEDHDIHVEDCDGNLWLGEVKNLTWPSGPARLWSLLDAALRQAEKHSDRVFAAYLPKFAEPQDALVMYRQSGVCVVTTLERFRAYVLGLGEADDDAEQDRKAA